MEVNIKLGFKYKDGEEKIKANPFWKRTEKAGDEQELLSSISLQVLAAPRAGPEIGPDSGGTQRGRNHE